MPAIDDTTRDLLQELSEAKVWLMRLKQTWDSGSGVRHEIDEAERKVRALEQRAQEAMKSLGCVSPETRRIYQGMADMLIHWHAFKDTLG